MNQHPCAENTIPALSASVQHWRLDPALWPTILQRIRELGFGWIEVYVPWSVHETKRGEPDFTGPRDIGRFLDLAREQDLRALVRPGPHANAEITGFGYPERILRDPAMLSRGPDGNPVWVQAPPRMFPAVSYAGDRLYRAFDRYLEALAEVLRPRLAPAGPVDALQADNEMTMFFRTAAFDQDYSPASLADYRAFIRERYRTVAALERAYRLELDSFDQLVPPRRFDATEPGMLPRYLDWIAFKEHALRRAVGRVRDLFRRHGLDRVPVTHNLPLGHTRSPLDLQGLEQVVDTAGMDLYYRKGDHRDLKARCLALCGLTRCPTSPEFGAGSHLAWPAVDLEDQVFTSLAAIMHGVRRFNFYMVVDRERWYGAPVRRDGSIDSRRAEFFRRLLALHRRLGACRRDADTVLVAPRLYGRLENLANAFEPLSPMALAGLGLDAPGWCRPLHLGCKRPLAATHARTQEGLFAALEQARLGFDLGETGGRLTTREDRLVVAPTFEILDVAAAEELLGLARRGATLVVGPDLPRLDDHGKPLATFGRALAGRGRSIPDAPGGREHELGAGRVVVFDRLDRLAAQPAELAPVLASLAISSGCRLLPDPGDRHLDVCVHRGGREVLWIANPTGERRVARPALAGATRLEDLWTSETFGSTGGGRIGMPPWTARPLEVRR